MSGDRAIEVLAEKHKRAPWGDDYTDDELRRIAKGQVEALASAGLQITDLTPERADAIVRLVKGGAPRLSRQVELEAITELRRLSGASGG